MHDCDGSLCTQPQMPTALFLGFRIQKEQSLFSDLPRHSKISIELDPVAFFKFKSLGEPLEKLKNQDYIL